MSVLSRWLASPSADAAVALTPESIAVAVLAGAGPDARVQGYAIEPLPDGVLAPGLSATNVLDRGAVVATLRTALTRLGGTPRRIALVLPDSTARVSLVRFEQVPARQEDLEQLVRWQVKKSSPFPIEDAALTFVPGAPTDGGAEFVAVVARRDVIREYEEVCEAVGMHAGLVDLSTFGIVNLLLAADARLHGDWLVVHVRPEYASLAIMRGPHLIYFRNLSEGDADALADVVHQTSMYYQDRLDGHGFSRVLLGGIGRTAGSLDRARRSLEDRLDVSVESFDTGRLGVLDPITSSPELVAILAPLVGTLMRMRSDAVVTT